MVRSRSTLELRPGGDAGVQGGLHGAVLRWMQWVAGWLEPVLTGPCRPAAPAGRASSSRRRPVEHDAAGLHHVAAVGDGQRGARVLVDEQDRRALRLQRRPPARRSRPPGAAPGPCWARRAAAAAGRPSARGRSPASAAGRPTGCRRRLALVAQHREQRVDALEPASSCAPRAKAPRRRLSSTVSGAEHLAALGHLHDAHLHALVGRARAPMSLPSKRDRARRAPAARRTARAAASSCPRRWRPPAPPVRPARTFRLDVGQRRDAAVAALQRAHFKHARPPRRPPRAEVGLDHARVVAPPRSGVPSASLRPWSSTSDVVGDAHHQLHVVLDQHHRHAARRPGA